MKSKMKLLFTGLFVLALLVGVTRVALAENYLNIPLNNDTAEVGTDCPADGGTYWHFVISPNNGDSYFIVFHLNLGDVATFDTSIFVPNGSQLDNVFVAVPGGKTLTSLIKEGSSADIYWNGDSPEPGKFQLSHLCPGTNPPLPPDPSKTAAGSFDKSFTWELVKSVDTEHQNIPDGGSATFHYTVAVSHDEGTIANVKVTGTITANNPNSDPVWIDSVTDQLSDGTVCAVTDGGAQALAPGATEFDYVCDLGSTLPLDPITNKATVAWSEQTLSNGLLPAGSSDTGDVAVSFTENTIDECITVNDPNAPSNPLGTVCVGDANPTELTY